MPSMTLRDKIARSAKRIVVKVGTNVLTDAHGRLDPRIVVSLCRQIVSLIDAKRQVVVVSSGAVGAGVGLLELPGRPKTLPMLQAAAAVGQGMLMNVFEKNLAKQNHHAAQILVTRSDFEDRRRYLNIRNTLDALQKFHTVPIINENDTVAVDELKFGDNDLIASLTANLWQADVLVLLSSVDGLIDGGSVVDFVESMDSSVLGLAKSTKSALGSGGMKTKLQAVATATTTGIHVVIANGRRTNVLPDMLLKNKQLGTLFAGQNARLASRRGWLAFAAKTQGRIVVDAGAAKALAKGGKSLLPSGITAVVGEFERGRVVAVIDGEGTTLARGVTQYSSAEIVRIKGKRSSQIVEILGPAHANGDEVIHRNNMIVVAD